MQQEESLHCGNLSPPTYSRNFVCETCCGWCLCAPSGSTHTCASWTSRLARGLTACGQLFAAGCLWLTTCGQLFVVAAVDPFVADRLWPIVIGQLLLVNRDGCQKQVYKE